MAWWALAAGALQGLTKQRQEEQQAQKLGQLEALKAGYGGVPGAAGISGAAASTPGAPIGSMISGAGDFAGMWSKLQRGRGTDQSASAPMVGPAEERRARYQEPDSRGLYDSNNAYRGRYGNYA